jgi:hypothetical protein
MEQKIVDARKRIAVLSARTGDGLSLRAALDRDTAKFPDLAPAEPNPEAERVKPLSPHVGSAQSPRWCKRCKVVFEGSACSKGHPNYLYSHKLPAEAGVVPSRDDLGATPQAVGMAPASSPRSPKKAHRSSWNRDVEEEASSPKTNSSTGANEAQNFLQEQARLQKIKAAEAKKKRAEKRLRRLSAKPSDDPSVAAALKQAAAAVAELEAVQESVPERVESTATAEQVEVGLGAEVAAVEEAEVPQKAEVAAVEEAAEAQAIAALARKKLAAKKAAKEAAAAKEAVALRDPQTPTKTRAVRKTIVPMVDIGMIRAINPEVEISPIKVADARLAIKKGDVEVSVDGTLQVAESGDVTSLSADAQERAVAELRKSRMDPRVLNQLAEAKAKRKQAEKTIVPMVDIGMIRAINPDVKISKSKVAGVRAAIKKGAVEVAVGGTLQVAGVGDVTSLSADAQKRAVAELRTSRMDPRIQERLRAAKVKAEEEAETAIVAVATERAERERQALAEVAAAREKAAEQRRAEAASVQAKKQEAWKLQQERAKAKAAKAAEAAAAAKEQEDRARELARQQHARESAAAAAKRKPLLPASAFALPEPSLASPAVVHIRSDSLATTGLSRSADALLAADVPRVGLRQPPLPLAELAAQPAPRQYLRAAVGPALTASLARLARASNTVTTQTAPGPTPASTPEKQITTLLSRFLLLPPEPLVGPEGPHADAEAASQLSASGVHGDSWRNTVRPLLENALAHLDLERPHEQTEAVEFVARTLRTMDT